MRHAVYDCVLEHMRERTVTDVVQEDSYHGARCLLVRYLHPFHPQGDNRLVHEVHSS